MFGLQDIVNLPPKDPFLPLDSCGTGSRNRIVLTREAPDKKIMIWDGRLIDSGNIHVDMVRTFPK